MVAPATLILICAAGVGADCEWVGTDRPARRTFIVEGMDNIENAANSARRWAKRKAGRYQSHAARGDWASMGSQLFDDTADVVYGAGDVLTFGGSKHVRTNVMGEVEYRDQGMYVGGQVAGVALGMAVGNYAGMPACQTANYLAQANAIGRGASAVNALRIARAYTMVESGVAMAQASAKIMSDEPVGLSDLASFAPLAGYALNRVGSHLTGDICFVAGTKVLTPEGRKSIEDVREGDQVKTRNHITGEEAVGTVARTFVTHPTRLHHLRYRLLTTVVASLFTFGASTEADELVVTGEHPFAVPTASAPGFAWKPAKDLKSGDRLILSNGSFAEVASNETENAAPGERFTTYNFEVEEHHTYFVSPKNSPPQVAGLWVHNMGLWNCRGEVTGGSSTTLARNLVEDMGLPRTTGHKGYQAAHLIPSELRSHEVLKTVGMRLDDATNGVFLRDNMSGGISAMARHQGKHPAYTDAVESALDMIRLRRGSNASVNVLRFDVEMLQMRLSASLQSGIPLYYARYRPDGVLLPEALRPRTYQNLVERWQRELGVR